MLRVVDWKVNLEVMSGWFGRRRRWEQKGPREASSHRGEIVWPWKGRGAWKEGINWGLKGRGGRHIVMKWEGGGGTATAWWMGDPRFGLETRMTAVPWAERAKGGRRPIGRWQEEQIYLSPALRLWWSPRMECSSSGLMFLTGPWWFPPVPVSG